MVSSEVPLCDAMKKAKMSDDVISIEYYFLQVFEKEGHQRLEKIDFFKLYVLLVYHEIFSLSMIN